MIRIRIHTNSDLSLSFLGNSSLKNRIILYSHSQTGHVELANSTITTCYNRKQLLHFLVVEQHPVDLGDGHVSRLLRLKVDKPIALRIPLFIKDHLTGEDISKSTEGVVECLVVNSLVQVLDEDVTYTRTPEGGVTLGPHDAHRSSLDHLKVHCVQGSLSYLGERE